jgi:hypothetical protein
MKRMHHFYICLIVSPGLVLLAGCGSSEALAPVMGRVTVSGKPLSDVQVQFIPDPEQGTRGPRSVGTTDQEGFYHLATDDGRPGAVVGSHIIVLSDVTKKAPDAVRSLGRKETNRTPPPSPKAGEPPPPSTAPVLRFPKEFSSSARTSLKKTVVEGAQTIDLEVPAPPPPPPPPDAPANP